jgi:DNA-binding NtrC family response regulator
VPHMILIVDDEKLLTKTLSNALKEAGYKTATATNAETAEKQIFSGKGFDLILLDNKLVNKSGLDILRKMRDQDVKAKVILMTAYDSPEVKSEAKRLKVNRYVKKPFDLPSMLDIVKEVIERN